MPYELIVKGTSDKVIAYACTNCRRPFFPLNPARWEESLAEERRRAEKCCPTNCVSCEETLGEEERASWRGGRCDRCRRERQAAAHREREEARRRSAHRIDEVEYTESYVYWKDGPGSDEGFYSSIGELIEECETFEVKPPEEVWACKPIPFFIDAAGIVEGSLEEHYEEAWEEIDQTDLDELQSHLNEWTRKTRIVSYEPDFTTLVVLQKEAVDG
jgi:hypothetical protein